MHKKNHRKIFLVLMSFVAVVAIAFWPQYPDDEMDAGAPLSGLPIKAGDGFWPGQYWLAIAQKKGWFTEAGLTVELVDIAADYYASLADTAEGRLDTNGFSLFDLVRFHLKGADLVAVIYADDSQGIDAVVARAGIESLSGLKGKRVGVEPGSYLEDILDEALERAGVDPSRIVKVKTVAETARDALASGQVDAVVTWEPVVSQALEVAGARKLFDTSQMPGISPAVRVFSRRFINERPGDVRAFIGVWRRATAFIEDHPDEAFAIVAQARGAAVDVVREMARTDRIMGLRDNLTGFSEGAGFISLHGRARKINGFLIRKGLTERRLDTLDFLDDRFIRALDPGGMMRARQ